MQTKFCSMSLNKWIQLNFSFSVCFSFCSLLFFHSLALVLYFHPCVCVSVYACAVGREFLVRKCRWHRYCCCCSLSFVCFLYLSLSLTLSLSPPQPLSPRIITLSIEFCFNLSFSSFLVALSCSARVSACVSQPFDVSLRRPSTTLKSWANARTSMFFYALTLQNNMLLH